jgi:hypothetical protein
LPAIYRLAAAAILVVLIGSAFVLERYGGLTFWPNLVTEFAATRQNLGLHASTVSRRLSRRRAQIKT